MNPTMIGERPSQEMLLDFVLANIENSIVRNGETG